MKHWEYSDYYKEEIIKLTAELDRWKTMAQRHNPSGCCCQIDENNGDPKMVEPCTFHAEWRDTALEHCKKSLLCEKAEHNATMEELEELQEEWNEEQSKMIRIQLERDVLRGKYHDLIMCVSTKYPNETRHETAKRYIMEREQSYNCSAAVEKKANTIKYGEGWGPPDCSTATVEKGEG